MDDHALLREYVEHQSEPAFADLVGRHLPMVYATALRLVRAPHLAEDVAQAVFIQLARKAWTIRQGHALPGWLYRATHYAALVSLRGENRRREYETTAMNLAEQNTAETGTWREIAPLLDEALTRLSRVEQDAVVLRFFQDKSYREVGQVLGLNESAARKRVERALEKIRQHFGRCGVTTTAALLGSAITAHAAPPAPIGLTAKVAGTSMSGATGAATVAQVVWKTFFMTTTSKIVTAVVIVALLAAIPLTMHWQKSNEPGEAVAPASAGKPTAAPAPQPILIAPPTKQQVASPKLPPAPVRESAATTPAPVVTDLSSPASSRNQAITNNLRQIASAASQYMLDKGVFQASYYDLLGSGGTDSYIPSVAPVAGEDYTSIVVHQKDTQIQLIAPDGTLVTFNM